MTNVVEQLHRIIMTGNATDKCDATHALASNIDAYELNIEREVVSIPQAAYPDNLKLVAPRELKRRGIQSQQGRNILMHAVAHIEFNAINLALDAAYRFRNQPTDFYRDWINIADDEARHFALIRNYLNDNDCDYGDYYAHNGLWQMAVDTQHDIVARMALVPRVLEARGLDVTPGIIKKFERVGDYQAVKILNTIYHDEIHHVKTGSKWFFHQCKLAGYEPRSTFAKLVKQYLHGELKGPFNTVARLQAGFDEIELAALNSGFN